MVLWQGDTLTKPASLTSPRDAGIRRQRCKGLLGFGRRFAAQDAMAGEWL